MANPEPSGLRERNKERRRRAIVAAARDAWREFGIAGATLEHIARSAGVAPQTLYNLIGSRDALMGAVLDELVDELERSLASREERGVALGRALISESVARFAADPDVFKPIVRQLHDTVLDHIRNRDVDRLQIEALRQARQDGALSRAAPAEVLGSQIFFAYMGALNAWASDRLDDRAFEASALLALYTSLHPFASAREQPRFAREVRRLARALAQ